MKEWHYFGDCHHSSQSEFPFCSGLMGRALCAFCYLRKGGQEGEETKTVYEIPMLTHTHPSRGQGTATNFQTIFIAFSKIKLKTVLPPAGFSLIYEIQFKLFSFQLETKSDGFKFGGCDAGEEG